MSEELELRIYAGSISTDEHKDLRDAIDNASDQDKTTYLTEGGKRIAAIVPAEVAAAHDEALADLLAIPLSANPDPRSVVETDPEAADRAAREMEAGGCTYDPVIVPKAGEIVTLSEMRRHLNAGEITGPDDLRRLLDFLHELWQRDGEGGHGINDEIRDRVLRMCAEGHPDAVALAREVLVTSAWDDVDRFTS